MRVRCTGAECTAHRAYGEAEEHRGGGVGIEARMAMMVAVPALIARLVPAMAVLLPIAAIVVPIVVAIGLDDPVLACVARMVSCLG